MSSPSHNAPPALASHPYMAAFWVIFAPIVVPVLGVSLLGAVWPGLAAILENAAPERADIAQIWLALAFVHFAYFILLTFWCENVGAGAFAGPMRVSANWIIAAILLGPPILLLPNIVMNQIMGGVDGWEFNRETNVALLSSANWTPAYLALVLFLAPIIEEVTFRGIGMGILLRRGVPPAMTAVFISAAFTLPHLQYSVPALTVVFVAGLGLAWLRLRSGTVVVPIIAHIAANGATTYLASLAPPPAG